MNVASTVLSVLFALPAPTSLARVTPQESVRHARVTEGAKIYNLADVKGKVIAEPVAGSIVAVHREYAAGWLEVEVPGGFAVWVFGRYLKPTETPGIYEVTGNAINLRPEPNGDPTSFPLPQRLQARDQVAVIGQLDEKADMDKTWVRIWSPPGVRGLIQADRIVDLEAGEDGHALWSAALSAGLQEAPAYPPPGNQAVPAVAPIERAGPPAVKFALEQAKQDLDLEVKKETPDYLRVREALEGVLHDAPGTATAIEAKSVLARLSKLEEALRVKEDLYRVRGQLEQEALDKQREAWERSREIDPLRETFLARGVLERRVGTDGTARYFLRFGLETTAELLCTSERYDFARFADYEVGVKGAQAGELEPGVDRIDVVRIEVLKRR